MTETDLLEIEARANAAEPGRWRSCAHGISCPCGTVWDDAGRCVTAGVGQDSIYVERRVQNATFIAHARTDVPMLIAEVRQLRSILNDRVEACICAHDGDGWCKDCKPGRTALGHT